MTTLRERFLGLTEHQRMFLDIAPPLDHEPIPDRQYLAEGWVYKDIPVLTKSQVETFIDVVGGDNIVWLTFAKGPNGCRGQMLISRSGAANLSSYMENSA